MAEALAGYVAGERDGDWVGDGAPSSPQQRNASTGAVMVAQGSSTVGGEEVIEVSLEPGRYALQLFYYTLGGGGGGSAAVPGGGSGCDVVDLQLSIVRHDDLTVEAGWL